MVFTAWLKITHILSVAKNKSLHILLMLVCKQMWRG